MEDLEVQIINGYQTVQNEESGPESEPVAPPCITHAAALEAVETLTLYKIQTGTMDAAQRQSCYRERWIEGAQTAEKSRQRQKTLEECMGVVGGDV